MTDAGPVPFKELEEMGTSVRNWGRWGDDDEIGALNLITPEVIRESAALVKTGTVVPLGLKIHGDGVWSANTMRRNPQFFLTVDGGDELWTGVHLSEWPDAPIGETSIAATAGSRSRFADDFISMNLQCSTQWDALSHMWYDGQIYNGFPSHTVTSRGATRNGIEKTLHKGIVSRGVLIDVARHRGLPHLPANEPIFGDELTTVAAAQDVEIRPGDIVVVRTGWWSTFVPGSEGTSWRLGCPGLHWTAASWIHEKEIAAIASDNLGVEAMRHDVHEAALPLHLLTLREMGVMLGEMWDLEQLSIVCADARRYEFQLVAPPLNIPGAVGSAINPLALL